MPSNRIRQDNNSACYFITLTVLHWYYLFDRYERWNILSDSLKYCIEQKGLLLYGFVFMLNHIHLLFFSSDATGFIRDFKKFTSKELKKNILTNEPHVLKLFIDNSGDYQFWQKTNMPVLIESEAVFLQKLQYIGNNPVRKKYVERPEYWYWSSANPHCELNIEPLL